MEQEADLQAFSDIFKIILIGQANAGKTALVYRYILDEVPESVAATVALEFTKRNIEEPGGAYLQLQIWDTAGQERFKSITKHHYRGADACLAVFDVTDRNSFTALADWLTELHENTDPTCQVYIIGNKLDLERRVTRDEAIAFAKAQGLPYFETSMFWPRTKPMESDKTRGGIESIFNLLVTDLIRLHSDRGHGADGSGRRLTGHFCTPEDKCLCCGRNVVMEEMWERLKAMEEKILEHNDEVDRISPNKMTAAAGTPVEDIASAPNIDPIPVRSRANSQLLEMRKDAKEKEFRIAQLERDLASLDSVKEQNQNLEAQVSLLTEKLSLKEQELREKDKHIAELEAVFKPTLLNYETELTQLRSLVSTMQGELNSARQELIRRDIVVADLTQPNASKDEGSAVMSQSKTEAE